MPRLDNGDSVCYNATCFMNDNVKAMRGPRICGGGGVRAVPYIIRHAEGRCGMDYKNLFDRAWGKTGVSGCFCAYGSFGVTDGSSGDLERLRETDTGFTAEYEDFTVCCTYDLFENGVCRRRDFFTAKDEELELCHYKARFLFEGGAYEVYTQYSAWQHESEGSWQRLNTAVEAAALGLRTTEGAAPMLALRSLGSGRIFVFHLLPNAQWSMRAAKVPLGLTADAVVVELGFNSRGLRLACHPGEPVEMPQIFFYEASGAADLDAWKLHLVYNRLYQRKRLPVMYNTWLLDFGKVDIEEIYRQIDCAAELGIEAFVVDAGWFGEAGSWTSAVGDWTESENSGYSGRLLEVSEYVRSRGLEFGLWFEPERAAADCAAVRRHPAYYFSGSNGTVFLDFSKEEAVSYITEVICGQIERYGIGIIKFDLNDSVAYDESGNGFYRYHQGHARFIRALRERYPGLYLINCASGGSRMDLRQNTLFDSTWISDNHSQTEWLRIYKETALRLPPCVMEKWDSRRFFPGFPNHAGEEALTLAFSCDGAMWNSAYSLEPDYTHALLKGGPIGFSGSIADYPEAELEELKKLIAAHKADGEFYRGAVLRILYDTSEITVLQYSDADSRRNLIQIFCNASYQSQLTVYPVLRKDALYSCMDRVETGGYFGEEGVVVEGLAARSKTAREFTCRMVNPDGSEV